MLPYFPFTEPFSQKMGTSPLSDTGSIIEIDHHYINEIQQKHSLLGWDPTYYAAALPGTEQAQWEVVDLVMASLARTAPHQITFENIGKTRKWQNNMLQEQGEFITGEQHTLPFHLPPLQWISRQVQEDLLILDPTGTLVAGTLCFPSGWDLTEKLGKNFMAVHAPLPEALSRMLKAAETFMDRLPIGKSIQRNNWGLRITDQLDLSTRHSCHYQKLLLEKASSIKSQEIGNEVYIRIEHQTLTRLPTTQHILFTIHTYQERLADELNTAERTATFRAFMQSVPPTVLDYKLITPLMPKLMAYLDRIG